MSVLDTYDKEVVVVYGDNAGSLSGLVVKCPAGYFLCMADGTVSICSFVDCEAAGISAGRVAGGFVSAVLAGGAHCKDVCLVVDGCIGFLAGKGGLLKYGNLLLGNGLCSLHGLNDVHSILGVHNHGLADSGGKDGLEAGDNGVLGHPAEVALLSVIGIAFVGGIEGGHSGEVAIVHKGQKAVGQVAGICTLEHDVTHIHGIRNIAGFHDAGCEEGAAALVNGGNTTLVGGYKGVDVAVYAAEFAVLVPAVFPLTVTVALQECTHGLCRSEFVVELHKFLILGCDIRGRRGNLKHGVLDFAGSLALVVLLVGVVESLDLRV